MKRKHLLTLALTFSCWSPNVGSAADAPPPAPQGEEADEVSADEASDEDVPWCKDEAIVKGAERLIRESGGTPLHFAALNNDTAAIRKLVSEGADIDAQTSAAGGVGSLPGGRLTPLHVAAAMQREDAALLLLELGADPTIVSGYRDTALHLAVSNGEVRLTEALVRARGVNINALQGIGMTPLALASMAPDGTKLMRLLLDAGADPNAAGDDGITPLYIAVHRDMADAIKLLLDAGAKPALSPKLRLQPFMSPEVLRLLIEAGVDPKIRDEEGNTLLHGLEEAPSVPLLLGAGLNPEAVNDNGETPLHNVANADVCRLLLEAGADPKARDKEGRTPLHLAADADVCRLLLEAGADPLARDGQGRTPLHLAGDADVCRLLLAAGADPKTRDKKGRTPLHFADDAGACRLLLEAGADPNARDVHRSTPLHETSDAEACRLLLKAGADPKARDQYERTPLHRAASGYDPDGARCRLLLEAGADPDARDEHGNTPLHVVNNAKACRLLLKAGADPDALDDEGHTPLQLIRRDEVRQVLLDAGAQPMDPLPDGGYDLEVD